VRVCLIGKFPPIQGGVSMRTYWSAHALAARGHEVHVVTNAKEIDAPFRMHMRAQDWQRCEADYGIGSVAVHWSDPFDRSQSYIPGASPFVSKLAGIAARIHSERPFDVVYSFYLEPYGVAGHLVAQMVGVPHVVRLAGSDAGRLWRHPQLEALYDHVLKSADAVIAVGIVAKRAETRGVDPARISFDGGIVIPDDLFSPNGGALDLAALRAEIAADRNLRHGMWGDFAGGRPYFGIYGKLGERKGSFALLAALERLKRDGVDVGLVALAHGQPEEQKAFRARASRLKLRDRILQVPFLPHWRVPEFLRCCLAVCCLEQNFPIGFHMPIIPREVLLCGACLVGSTEVIRKLPGHARLQHAYGCVAIKDVTDIAALSRQLAAIAIDPEPRSAVGARGRAFACEMQQNIPFPQALEQILAAAAARRRVGAAGRERNDGEAEGHRFPLTKLALTLLSDAGPAADAQDQSLMPDRHIDLQRARKILAAIERTIRRRGGKRLKPLLPRVLAEIAVATAEDEVEPVAADGRDPLFRLRTKRWAVDDRDLFALIPVRDPRVRVIAFDFDVSAFMQIRTADELLDDPAAVHSYLVAFARSGAELHEPLLVQAATAEFLECCDGTRSVAEILGHSKRPRARLDTHKELQWIEEMFLSGLLWLQDERIDPSATVPRQALKRIEVRSPCPPIEVRDEGSC
jgi:glycosyltransferase involved in cell wall biosynthesis